MDSLLLPTVFFWANFYLNELDILSPKFSQKKYFIQAQMAFLNEIVY